MIAFFMGRFVERKKWMKQLERILIWTESQQMIVIDKLCYQSGLRYVNATEKFVYAMFSLLLCVLSRSVWAPLLVFTANGILTVKKGGIPLFRYIKLLLIPAGFCLSAQRRFL